MTIRAAVSVLSLVLPLWAGSVPKAVPEDVGLSAERLQRIKPAMQRYIDRGEVSGCVTLVARKGRVAYFEAQGLMDVEARKPMRTDTIFRIASQRKPITATAVLMLYEEGKLYLTDPVSKYIPEFKNQKVAIADPSRKPPYYLVPASREITIRDLLTHTSGLGADRGAVAADLGVRIKRTPEDTLAGYIPRLGSVPLDFQPGTAWSYSSPGFEVLARLVEIASGIPFDKFLRQRIFDPLGMKDSYFREPEENRSRVTPVYRKADRGLVSSYHQPPVAYYTESGGLYSTAEDYLQFAQMLLNSGELNGKRLLSRKTVQLMTSEYVSEEMFTAGHPGEKGYGFGLSVSVLLDPRKASNLASEGNYGWSGAFGTNYRADPAEQLIGLFMIQNAGGGPKEMSRDFQHLAMEAIVE